jgi:hypothetical protein
MPQSTFLADATQFIDLVSQSFAPAGLWDLGVNYAGGSKSFVRRPLGAFDVFGAAASGRPLTAGDTVTAADLLLEAWSFLGPGGFAARVERITRADWDYTTANWNRYRTGANWTAAGGDVGTPPAALAFSSPVAPGPQVVAGMLAFVTDAVANRNGRVTVRLKQDNEAPPASQWCSFDAALASPLRPRLRVTYVAADPTPVDDPAGATLGAPRPQPAATPARPSTAGVPSSPSAPARSSRPSSLGHRPSSAPPSSIAVPE